MPYNLPQRQKPKPIFHTCPEHTDTQSGLAGVREGSRPQGWVGRYREDSWHPQGPASAPGTKEREPPQRVRTHIQVGQRFIDHAKIAEVVFLGRVVLVGPQELPQ